MRTLHDSFTSFFKSTNLIWFVFFSIAITLILFEIILLMYPSFKIVNSLVKKSLNFSHCIILNFDFSLKSSMLLLHSFNFFKYILFVLS